MYLSFTIYRISGPTSSTFSRSALVKCKSIWMSHQIQRIRMVSLSHITEMVFGLSIQWTTRAISMNNKGSQPSWMRNNLKAGSSLYADPTGDKNSVTSSSLVNFWVQRLLLPCVTFTGTVTQQAWGEHTGFLTCPRVRGWLSKGLATTASHMLPATIRKHEALGTTLSGPRSLSKTWNSRERKAGTRAPQRPMNSSFFMPWFFFSSCWMHCSLWSGEAC